MTTINSPIDTSGQSSSFLASLNVTSQSHRNVLYSCIAGNALEWYDFVIYGYFVAIFGQIFFPNVNPVTQMLASWGIFWSGFLARPLGSIVFGHIGDKTSRKTALTWSIFMMAIPTMLIGCLPTYAQIGLFAPLAMVILRTLQGFAIGGEYTGTMVFLVEYADEGNRGIWGSWASFSAVLGVIVGSLLVTFLNIVLTHDQLVAWGWRIPFVISILGSMVGLYIRMKLSDPKVYLNVKKRKKTETAPLKDLILHYKKAIGTIFMLDVLTAVGFFIIAIFLATYHKSHLNFSAKDALLIHSFSMFVLAIAILIGGRLSDRYGRKLIMGIGCAGIVVFAYPLFDCMQSCDMLTVLASHSAVALFFGLFFGIIPSALSEMIPTKVRFSGLSIAHNLCMAIIGGGTPLASTYLISHLQDPKVPAYLLMIAAAISFMTLFFFKDRSREALD